MGRCARLLAVAGAVAVAAAAAVLILAVPAPAPAPGAYAITDLGTLGGDASTAHAVDARGRVVGAATVILGGQEQQAFLYAGGVLRGLGALPGGRRSVARALNGAGVVVGYSEVADPSYPRADHAFAFTGGRLVDLGSFVGCCSYAMGINDQGLVVGWSGDEQEHAFLYNLADGTWRDLGTLGGCCSRAFAINGAGQVAGEASVPGNWRHAFLYTGGRLVDLGTLGGCCSAAYGISAAGHVVGAAHTGAGLRRAFLYQGGRLTDLGALPGGGESWANAVNAHGHAAGGAHTAAGQPRAVLFRDGQVLDLNGLLPPGSDWELWEATGINDAGQIVGVGMQAGERHGFLLTPAR